jgi:elongation factor 3
LRYVAGNILALFFAREFEESEWKSTYVTPYLINFVTEEAANKIVDILIPVYVELDKIREARKNKEEAEDGEELCNCEFSLAYGGMILLNNTKFRLHRGSRYGLCGPNGCGKSTLMRAIANGQVEGFPSPEVLRTIFVEHNLQSEEADFPVLDFICGDPRLAGLKRDDISKALGDVGFDADRLAQPVGSLSGGFVFFNYFHSRFVHFFSIIQLENEARAYSCNSFQC